MTDWDKDNLRFVISEEVDADSPVSENLMDQLRKNIEALTLLLFGAAIGGTLTSNPNDTTGTFTDSAASYNADEHNLRTILITSGVAKNEFYQIDDTTATTLVCTGDTPYADGVRSGDSYIVLYALITGVNSGHNHNGLNSETVVPAAASLTQSMLKTSLAEEIVTDTDENYTLPGGEYSFYPQFKVAYDDIGIFQSCMIDVAQGLGSTSYVTNIYLLAGHVAGTYATLYCQNRYVTSSGDVHWIFLLRDYATGRIMSKWQAPDHPCFGNGGKPLLIQHPFLSTFEEDGNRYKWVRDPETGLITDQKQRVEIIVINPSLEDVATVEKNRIVDDEEKADLSWLESFDDLFDLDESRSADWPDIPITVGLPKTDEAGDLVDDWRFMPRNTHVKPIKKTITRPNLVEAARYKERAGRGRVDV